MKKRIYIDNSVIGGYYDDEFNQETKLFFEQVEKGEYYVYYSEINETELSLAPKHIKEVKNIIPADCVTYVEFDNDSKELGDTYIRDKILGPASLNDAYHIAIATINRIDVLVSWNFKHIVNYDKIQQFNSVNLKLGYPTIDIRTPKEMIHYED